MSVLSHHLQIRWPLKREIEELSLIDRRIFGHNKYWSVEKFNKVKQLRDVVINVVEFNNVIVGYNIFRLKPTSITIVRMAIDYNYRNYGFGQALIGRLYEKLGEKRSRINISVPYELVDWYTNIGGFEIISHNSNKSLVNLSLEFFYYA